MKGLTPLAVILSAALLAPPPEAPFDPVVLLEVDRGTHLARKIALNLGAHARVAALMTIPKGRGPFPAVLLLHDHGARFDIGKEKMIEPLDGDAQHAFKNNRKFKRVQFINCKVDKITYAFLKSNQANLTGIILLS